MAKGNDKVFFFCNGVQVDVDQDALTGAQIKAAAKQVIPTLDLSHELVLESPGHEGDTVIADGTTVPLTHGHGEGPKHFFTRPPTNFGAL